MARWSIAALVVLNLALAAWNLGALSRWGWGPADTREPQRLTQQIRPKAITLQVPPRLTESSASAADAASLPASAPTPIPETRRSP